MASPHAIGVQANKVIDLTTEDEEPAGELGPEWSTDSLFVATHDDDDT